MSQLWPLSVTVPAGTLPTAPIQVPWSLADVNLDYIDIVVPDGHSGQTGVQILWAGTVIIPWSESAYLIANNEKIHVEVGTYITVTGLVVQAYNEGIYDHSFYLRAHITYTTAPVVTQAPAIGTAVVTGSSSSTYQNTLTPSGISSLTSSPAGTTSIPGTVSAPGLTTASLGGIT